MRALKLLFALAALMLVATACGGPAEESGSTVGAGSEPAPAETAAPTGSEMATGGSEMATGGSSEAATGGGSASSDVQAAMVTDVGGLGDQSFNDSANAGLERAEEELGVTINVLESGAPTDYVNNLTQLAENGFSPIFAVGFLMTDALAEIAPQFPDTNFAIIDSVVEEPNVTNIVFEEQQGSYLAGIVAGLMTQQDTEFTNPDDKVVGFLGGLESELIEKFEAGYTAGVYSVCPDCQVLSQYAGTTPDAFNDPAAGKEISLNFIDQGADIIYHASGATGAGLFEAATDRNVFAIGVDSNQAEIVPDAPILTSMLKRVDNAVFQVVEQAVNGEIPSGETVAFGLSEDGVALAPFGEFEQMVPQEVTTAVDEARQAIIDGEVTAPTTMADVQKP
ncbi:MAG: BMP family lipoprotein [Egibacteraceae bacterium]